MFQRHWSFSQNKLAVEWMVWLCRLLLHVWGCRVICDRWTPKKWCKAGWVFGIRLNTQSLWCGWMIQAWSGLELKAGFWRTDLLSLYWNMQTDTSRYCTQVDEHVTVSSHICLHSNLHDLRFAFKKDLWLIWPSMIWFCKKHVSSYAIFHGLLEVCSGMKLLSYPNWHLQHFCVVYLLQWSEVLRLSAGYKHKNATASGQGIAKWIIIATKGRSLQQLGVLFLLCSEEGPKWRAASLQGSIFWHQPNGGSTISALVLTSWCSTLMHPMTLMSGHLRLMPVCSAWRIPWTLIFDVDMTSFIIFIDLGELSLQPWSPTQQKRTERNSTYVLEIVISKQNKLFNLIWSETWS